MAGRFFLSAGLVLGLADPVAARAPGAQELIDEFRDSQVILGEHYTAVMNSLLAALEGRREVSEMESHLQRFVEEADEHMATFDGLNLRRHDLLEDLQAGYVSFLQWRSEEVPRAARAALKAGRSTEGAAARRRAMEQALLLVARGEERWLDELATLERLAVESAVAGPVESGGPGLLERYGKWLILFSGSTLVVALLLWGMLRKQRSGGPRDNGQGASWETRTRK